MVDSNQITDKTILEELQSPFEVSEKAISFFQENGYVKIKQVLSKELLDYYGGIITEQVVKLNNLTKPMAERTTYEKAFLQIMNIWTKSTIAKEFTFSKRLAKIATDLMQVRGVRLYHDQALYKEAGGGITPWHADQFYWPLSSSNTITVWVPFQETTMEMGPLAFAEKSQTAEIGRNLEISDESESFLQAELGRRNFTMNNSAFELGEISYHAGWTFHRAGSNTTNKPRRVMTIIYMDKDITLKEPANNYQKNDWNDWCLCYPIGSVPEGPLNPVLFSY